MSIYIWFLFFSLIFMGLFFYLKNRNKRMAIISFLAALIILFAPIYLPNRYFGNWNSISPLDDKIVKSIILNPSQPKWEVNLTDTSLMISNKQEIDKVLELLKKTQPYFPNHPTRFWESQLILITTKNDSLIVKVEKIDNEVALIATKDGKFRQDVLAKYLEQIAKFKKPKYGK